MAIIEHDWVWETATVSGTGSVTLPGTPAQTGARTFVSVYANNDQCPYVIADNTTGASESGIGTITVSGTVATLARTVVIESTNSNTLVDFAGNACGVFVTKAPGVQTSAGAADAGSVVVLGPDGFLDGSMLTEILPSQKVGNWYTSFTTSFSTGTVGNSTLYFSPIWVPQDHVYQNIGFQSQSSSLSQTTNISLGLALDAGGVPSTSLFYDAGQVNVPTTTNYGSYSASISGAGTIPRGIIWAIIGTDAVAGTAGLKLWQLNGWLVPTLLGFTSPAIGNVNNPAQGYSQSWTPGSSLPTTFSSFSNAPTLAYAFNAWIQA